MKTLQISAHPTDTAPIRHRRAALAYRDLLTRIFPPPAGASLHVTSSDPQAAKPNLPTLTLRWDETLPEHDLWAFVTEDGVPSWDRIALAELAMCGLVSQRELA